MTHEKLPIKKLHPAAILPTRAHADDAGLDLYGLEDVKIAVGGSAMARTGIGCALPKKTVGMICDRSSMAKKQIKVAGGIIDAGYRGEIQIVLLNLSREEVTLKAGERIAQMLILPIETPLPIEVESLDETTRGAGGFGSSGK